MKDRPVDTRTWPLRSTESYLMPEGFDAAALEGILISGGEMESRINKVRLHIFNDYERQGLHVLTILKGASTFKERLFASEHHALEHSFGFVNASSYKGTQAGELKINSHELTDQLPEMKGKHILIVEDIVDTGQTLTAIYSDVLRQQDAYDLKSVRTCALLDKPDCRKSEYADLQIDYLGFIIPDRFVVGFGLDYDGKYRSLPHICVLKGEH